VIVADNRPNNHRSTSGQDGIRVVRAPGLRSPPHARNQGARAGGAEWLVFLDADTEPDPGLLDAYLSEAPAPDVGVLAGGIHDVAKRDTPVARYVCVRAKMHHAATLSHGRAPYALTANCAVRRAAFDQVGGFAEAIRAGEDADLCWRLQAAGWRVEVRPGARVAHRARETARALLGQMARHGSGAGWLNRRYPGAFPPPEARAVVGRFPHYLGAAARARRAGDRDGARFALLDLAALCAFDLGRLLPNAPLRR
jgi:hypothetical protein